VVDLFSISISSFDAEDQDQITSGMTSGNSSSNVITIVLEVILAIIFFTGVILNTILVAVFVRRRGFRSHMSNRFVN
jgi:hypothetical protein